MFVIRLFVRCVRNSRSFSTQSVFSCEMEQTLVVDKWSQKLVEYAALIPRLTDSFRIQKTARQTMREGHRKTSFVYLLIDPRIAENLVGESNVSYTYWIVLLLWINLCFYLQHVTKLETWDTFVRSIFYVGKGKNNRPFAHLYDAIKVFKNQQENLLIPNKSKKSENAVVLTSSLSNSFLYCH